MARLYLVRHGKAAAGWDAELDPGLDILGRAQAKTTARALAPLGPLNMLSSPLARALQTSAPLAEIWNGRPQIEERVGEIPSPTKDLMERTQWLRCAMNDKWSRLDRKLQAWRRGVLEALCGLDKDTVVFTHFIAINVAVGEATGDDHVVCFWPDNGSVTIVDVHGTVLALIERGLEVVAKNGKAPRIL
jgi:broad specificity phosphatase PhoE